MRLQPDPEAGHPDRLDLEARRTCDRLRSMPLARLTGPAADGQVPSVRVLALAQRLADEAATLAGRPARVLPALAAAACGDVLAVCSNDLVEQLRATPDAAICSRAVADLVALRRLL